MVFVVLHKDYVAFANVRIFWIPQELRQAGELRLTKSGHLLHQINRPSRLKHVGKYLDIPSGIIDRQDTWAYGYGLESRLCTVITLGSDSPQTLTW